MALKLKPGDFFPDATLVDHTGQSIPISHVVAERPTLLAFYRGHW